MGVGYPCYRPPSRHREGRKGESKHEVREQRRECSHKVIGIIKSMPNNLDVAIEIAEKVAGGTLRIIVKPEKEGEKHIILRNPEENDRRHGHVVVCTAEDGKKFVEYTRPYGELRRSRR